MKRRKHSPLGVEHQKIGRYEVWDTGYETPCWLWLGRVSPNGYAKWFTSHGETHAHRISYRKHKGAIPPRYQVDHLCGIRSCINPDHLEAVPQVENLRRGRGTKLTPEKVRAIVASDEPHAVLAERYGVTRPYISTLKSGRRWVDVLEAVTP